MENNRKVIIKTVLILLILISKSLFTNHYFDNHIIGITLICLSISTIIIYVRLFKTKGKPKSLFFIFLLSNLTFSQNDTISSNDIFLTKSKDNSGLIPNKFQYKNIEYNGVINNKGSFYVVENGIVKSIKEYDESGNLTIYITGNFETKNYSIYEKGKIIQQYKVEKGNISGNALNYFEDGKILSSLTYKDSKLNGKSYYFNNEGDTILIINFVNDIPSINKKTITLKINDLTIEENTFYDNKTQSKIKNYYFNKKPYTGFVTINKEKCLFIVNKKVKFELVFVNDKLFQLYNLENDIKNGYFYQVFPNQIVEIEGEYKKGKPSDIWFYYTLNGNLEKCINIENPKLELSCEIAIKQ